MIALRTTLYAFLSSNYHYYVNVGRPFYYCDQIFIIVFIFVHGEEIGGFYFRAYLAQNLVKSIFSVDSLRYHANFFSVKSIYSKVLL